jgi:hypothetical protein
MEIDVVHVSHLYDPIYRDCFQRPEGDVFPVLGRAISRIPDTAVIDRQRYVGNEISKRFASRACLVEGLDLAGPGSGIVGE